MIPGIPFDSFRLYLGGITAILSAIIRNDSIYVSLINMDLNYKHCSRDKSYLDSKSYPSLSSRFTVEILMEKTVASFINVFFICIKQSFTMKKLKRKEKKKLKKKEKRRKNVVK